VIVQPQADQFFVALEEMGDRTLRNGDAAVPEDSMDFRDAVVVGVAEGTDKRDDVEAELAMGQGPGAFCLGTIRLAGARTACCATSSDDEVEATDVVQGRDGAGGVIGDDQRGLTTGTRRVDRC
jgi:hypothetical protein